VSDRKSRGFSLLELLIVIAIILVILAVALPGALNAKLNASETVVMREMQTLYQAQALYNSQFGRFASTLRELGPPDAGDPGPQAAKIIPRSLASGEKDGYLFAMTTTPAGYSVNAKPKVFGQTGRRTFYIDEDGIVHENWGRDPATPASPEIQ